MSARGQYSLVRPDGPAMQPTGKLVKVLALPAFGQNSQGDRENLARAIAALSRSCFQGQDAGSASGHQPISAADGLAALCQTQARAAQIRLSRYHQTGSVKNDSGIPTPSIRVTSGG